MSCEELQQLSVSTLAGYPGAGGNSSILQGFLLLRQYRCGESAAAAYTGDFYFSAQWAVLRCSHLFLFDNPASRGCRRAICLPRFTLQSGQPPDYRLWPSCSGHFSLEAGDEQLQFGCVSGSSDRKWHKKLLQSVAKSKMASAEGSEETEAKRQLQLLLTGIATWQRQQQLQQQQQQQQQRQQQQQPDNSEDVYEVSNQYVESVSSVDDFNCRSLADLLDAGEHSCFGLEFVAKAMHTGNEDTDALWEMMEAADTGTFMLTGFHDDESKQQQPQLLVTHRSNVFFIPLLMEADNKISIDNGMNEAIFDCLEALVFHYILHGIQVPGESLTLQKPFGCPQLSRTQLFASCLWHLADKDTCSRMLSAAPPGTYALRKSGGGDFTLTVQCHSVGAKLLLRRMRNRTGFCVQSLGWRYDSLEQMLEELHHRPFPINLNRLRLDLTLRLPYQASAICKAQLQEQVYGPLRSSMFYRGSWEQAHSLMLKASARQFLVWLSVDAGSFLLVRLPGGVVESFRICSQDLRLRCLPQQMHFLENCAQLRFDSVEALIAHLQSNAGPLRPHLSSCLLQPVSR